MVYTLGKSFGNGPSYLQLSLEKKQIVIASQFISRGANDKED